ncbi:hypothetical protein ACN4EG_14775 [Alkalinema pantanalense CENA528]|uniref:hypothetical protein n=1 Tax=Alkalinema pantanalense TaxID=1620705 RepID=UPI003D6EB82E
MKRRNSALINSGTVRSPFNCTNTGTNPAATKSPTHCRNAVDFPEPGRPASSTCSLSSPSAYLFNPANTGNGSTFCSRSSCSRPTERACNGKTASVGV